MGVSGGLAERAVFQPAWAEAMLFMACDKCGRIVPHWRYCMTAAEVKAAGGHVGCWCGAITVRPSRIPEWKAAWWVLVRGYLIRKVLQRKQHWDPRAGVKVV
jgi:hypothetical protein